MSQISYLNGTYVPHKEAYIHIDDRGLQFSDGVYEVVAFFNSKPLDMAPHLKRLQRSLSELLIHYPGEVSEFGTITTELIRRNNLENGIVYIQITRGVAPRDHVFPEGDIRPTVIATARPIDLKAISTKLKTGVSVTLVPENRWARPDIKSTSLLGNILAKQAAKDAGTYEAWYVDRNGLVTEGTASNAAIITKQGILVTRKTDGAILAGITRTSLMAISQEAINGVEERGFTVQEIAEAKEAFLTSTTNFVMPVIKIGDTQVGDGAPGEITLLLQKAYFDYIKRETGFKGFEG